MCILERDRVGDHTIHAAILCGHRRLRLFCDFLFKMCSKMSYGQTMSLSDSDPTCVTTRPRTREALPALTDGDFVVDISTGHHLFVGHFSECVCQLFVTVEIFVMFLSAFCHTRKCPSSFDGTFLEFDLWCHFEF